MAEKKIQPKRPATDEPAAGARKAEKTTARRAMNRKMAKMTARKQARKF
jgi:hypothetical protein